jgi:hypothetical protein
MMDWLQVWNEDLDTHRQKLPWSPADQNNINNNEENQFECQIMTKKNKQIVLYPKDIRDNKPPGVCCAVSAASNDSIFTML